MPAVQFKLSTVAPERGTYAVTCGPFQDVDGTTVTPLTTAWTLTDSAGVVVNSRSAVTISPASTIVIVLSGLDLAVGTGLTGTARKLYLAWTFNSSTYGSNLPGTAEIKFEIADFTKPSGIT